MSKEKIFVDEFKCKIKEETMFGIQPSSCKVEKRNNEWHVVGTE